MRIIRLLLIVLLGALLVMVLRLPDEWRADDTAFAELPPADFRRLASVEWKSGRHASAILLLNYAIENQLPDAAACEGVREGYLTVMAGDNTGNGRLAVMGLERPQSFTGGFDSLSGVTVAEWFVTDTISKFTVADEFSAQLAVARELTVLFPPAEPALRLTAALRQAGLLRNGLRMQIERALHGMAAAGESSAAVVAVQETIMPLFQLARQCRTWAEFAVLVRHADSVDQIKLLTRMASLTPLNAGKLARPLVMAQAENRSDLPSAMMDYIVRRGQVGMDNLDYALRRGVVGIDYLLRHPDVNTAALAAPGVTTWPPPAWRAAWQAWQARAGLAATLAKAVLVVLLCAGILACLLPWKMLRGAEMPSGESDSAVDARSSNRRFKTVYWVAIILVSIAVAALLMLGGSGMTTPDTDTGQVVPGSGDIAVPAGAGTHHLVSWLIILTVILVVQGTCWEMARRKIRAVADDQRADTDMKLRRLENLDIFFDLPLYAGLALTIFAFILISTLGAGVSRFLAYSSTFVGILFAVALRMGYLYPLREKLITGKDRV